MRKTLKILLILAALSLTVQSLYSARIKDIATIEGVNAVQVIGYGLVSGLNNTGDNQMASFTVQSVSNLLKRFGLTIPQSNPRIRNVAAVIVTATVPAFTRKGGKIDVQVASIGDATSLQGGILMMTPLSISDGGIIGMAQGALSVSGFDVSSLGSRMSKNMVTSGRVPNGLILEKDMEAQFIKNQQIRIVLREPDFTTAINVVNAVNGVVPNSATASDAGSVLVKFPANLKKEDIVQNIARLEILPITTDPAARVVINERTGTVVVGGNVQLLPAVIAQGGLEISIQKQVIVTPPAPFTVNPPKAVETSVIKTEEPINPATALQVAGPTVQDMAAALNLLKVSPRDLISIFQALKEVGSLQGELIIQ